MRTLTKGILNIFISSDIFYYSNIDMKHPHIKNGINILQANEHFVAIFENFFFQLLGDLFPSYYLWFHIMYLYNTHKDIM